MSINISISYYSRQTRLRKPNTSTKCSSREWCKNVVSFFYHDVSRSILRKTINVIRKEAKVVNGCLKKERTWVVFKRPFYLHTYSVINFSSSNAKSTWWRMIQFHFCCDTNTIKPLLTWIASSFHFTTRRKSIKRLGTINNSAHTLLSRHSQVLKLHWVFASAA